MIEGREFGASLRRERERRGVSLDEIAEQTKVSASVLGGLERGDLSRWPSGIFRRAFVRSYAAAVGLDVEDTLAEFLRVFPEDGGPIRPRAGSGAHALRLTLGEHGGGGLDWRRLGGAAIDAAAILAAAGAAWMTLAPATALVAVTSVAVLWHAAGVIAWGTTPGIRIFRRRPPVPVRAEGPRTVAPAEASQDISARPLPPAPGPSMTRGRLARRDRRAAMRAERSHGSDTRIQRS